MSTREAVEIKRFGLTEVYVPQDEMKTVAIVVFVHGLFGHPQRTWTGIQACEQNLSVRSAQSNTVLRSTGRTSETRRLSIETDSGTEPEVNNRASASGISIQRQDSHQARILNKSRITGQKSGEVFWPSSILPTVLPEARIFTWGYDADVDAFNTSVGHNTVEQHAQDLLTDVANLSDRLGVMNRPLIFVVHSLGGIVVKEALNIASQSEIQRLKDVASATFGIAFLGTPHRGSGSATIGKHAYRIARLGTKRPNIKLLRSLEKNSDILTGISNRFRSTQQKWDIKISSFYEDREVRKFFFFHSLIVDNDSAKIGHPGEEVSSIPKNHREMTKFTSAEEVGFDRVSSQLRRWINDIVVKSQRKDLAQELKDCLSSLESAQTRTRYINVASSYDGTLQWLYDRETVGFVDWLKEKPLFISDGSISFPRPVFWINGKPGSGKSTLMKFAMRDERTRSYLQLCNDLGDVQSWILLGFFFHDRGSHIQKSIEGMLQGVLHQLLSQVPDLLPFVCSIYDDLVKAERKPNPTWTFDSLFAAWVAVTKQRIVRLHACLFLDALDEHEGDNSELSKFIHDLISNIDNKMVRLKICVASRNWNIFGEHFGTCPQFAIHDFTAEDIRAYTSERLSGTMVTLSEEARQTLEPKIDRLAANVTTKARGVFIWVRIVVDELVKGIRDGTAVSVLEEKLSKMPEELGDLYHHTLERVEPEYAEEAYFMLQITLSSLSPLPLDVFMNCVSYSIWGEVHESFSEEMRRKLRSRSGGLLELVYSRPVDIAEDVDYKILAVQFIHQTVKDFVAEKTGHLGLHLPLAFTPRHACILLLECAVRFGKTWAAPIIPFIFEYAYLAEAGCLSSSREIYEAFRPLIKGFDWHDKLNLRDWVESRYPQCEHFCNGLETTEVLFALFAASGLKGVISTIVDLVCEDDAIQKAFGPHILYSTGGRKALAMVSFGPRLSTTSASRESMLKLLLDLGIERDLKYGPLEREDDEWLSEGYPTYDSLLIEAEQKRLGLALKDPSNAYPTLSWLLRPTPQKHISEEEKYSLANLLLSYGSRGASPDAYAIPHECCPQPRRLLYNCIRHYDVEAVRLLLLHGADTSVIDHSLIFTLYVKEAELGTSKISELLAEEHGFQEIHDPESRSRCNTAAALTMLSGLATLIGSPTVGINIAIGHTSSKYFWPDAWEEDKQSLGSWLRSGYPRLSRRP